MYSAVLPSFFHAAAAAPRPSGHLSWYKKRLIGLPCESKVGIVRGKDEEVVDIRAYVCEVNRGELRGPKSDFEE